MSDYSNGTFDPLADAIPGDSTTVDVRAFLVQVGVAKSDIDASIAEGTIELLALEQLVDIDTPKYDIDEVAALSGVDAERIRGYWRALGFPDPRGGEKLFGDADLEMLSSVVWFISEGALEPEVALQIARVIGSSLERIARALIDTIETRRSAQRAGEAEARLSALDDPSELSAPDDETCLHAWGRTVANVAKGDGVRLASSSRGCGATS